MTGGQHLLTEAGLVLSKLPPVDNTSTSGVQRDSVLQDLGCSTGCSQKIRPGELRERPCSGIASRRRPDLWPLPH
jgi:hypothetical protein